MTISSIAGAGEFLPPASVPNNPATKVANNEDFVTTKTAALPQQVKTDTVQPEPEQVQEAVNQIQQFTQTLAQNLKFSIDEDTGKTVVKILDTQTQEVIRQIPSEEAITIARTLGKIQGLLFNDKA